ncbi:MAG: cytochrome c biogenesis protein ResB [Candidatus Margulisiibacteriota bacterium]
MLSLILCRGRRWPKTRNQWGTYLLHMGIPVLLTGALVGMLWGQSGTMLLHEGERSNTAVSRGGRNIELPFSVKLARFSLEMYPVSRMNFLDIADTSGRMGLSVPVIQKGHLLIPELTAEVSVEEWLNDFILDEKGKARNRSTEWNNPAIHLRWGKESFWLFARYADYGAHARTSLPYQFRYRLEETGGGIKSYKSAVQIIDDKAPLLSKTIQVNDPLRYKGYTFYQMSYDRESLSWTGLHVKKDPGVWLVYLGTLMMIAGLFMNIRKGK